MTRPSAAEIREILDLEAHPTCGFTAQSYRSSQRIPAAALPIGYDGDRDYASVLYFLVTPDAAIKLHRIRSDQIYHHYLGDPLEVLLLYPDGNAEIRTVGSELDRGMRPQLLIPGDTFHVSRVRAGGEYALLGTTEWPGFDPADLELGDPRRLAEAYPAHEKQIADFCGLAGRA